MGLVLPIVAAALLVAAGCQNDLDALFDDSLGDGGAATEEIGRVSLPLPDDPYERAVRLFDDTEACIGCMETECGDEAMACADDADCTAEVLCRTRCEDPGCVQDCIADLPVDMFPSRTLLECGGLHCTDACRVGHNWDCVDQFAYATPEMAGDVTLQIRMQSNAGDVLPGLSARVCELLDPDCETPYGDVATTDADGLASVKVPWLERAGSAGPEPFQGYLEVRDEQTDPPRYLTMLYWWQFWPTRSNTYPWELVAFTAAERDAARALWGLVSDPSRGSLTGSAYDCDFFPNAAPARGATVAVDTADADSVIVYSGNPALTEIGEGAGLFTVSVPVGQANVAIHVGEEEVASMRVNLRAGDAVTWAFMTPRAGR